MSSLLAKMGKAPLSTREGTFAQLLRKEFGVPFGIFDSSRTNMSFVPSDFPAELASGECYAFVRRVIAQSQAEVEEDSNWRLLGLPIWRNDQIAMVAVGAFHMFAGPGDSSDAGSASCPVPASCLRQWAQAVADRHRLQEQMRNRLKQVDQLEQQISAAGKMLETVDRLATRLRIVDQPERFQTHTLRPTLELLDVECLASVPVDPHAPVAVAGNNVIEPSNLRRLVLEAIAHHGPDATRAFTVNHPLETPWGVDFPNVRSIAIVTADESKPSSWLVAINKKGNGGFRSVDTAIMRPIQSLLHVHRKNLNVYIDLKELLFGVVRALTSAIDAKDPYTRGHSERVARVAVVLGRQMKLGSDELSNLYLAGLLHDVGKIGVQDEVLKKPGALTPSEYRHVMSHVEIGVAILRELKRLRHVLPGIMHHHEAWSGKGYPDGIKGEDIPMIARILAVADSFDAMSSDRPYRSRRHPSEVATIMKKGAGDQLDPRIIEAALACWHELCAIQQRGLGESLRVAVDEALNHDYDGSGTRAAPPALTPVS